MKGYIHLCTSFEDCALIYLGIMAFFNLDIDRFDSNIVDVACFETIKSDVAFFDITMSDVACFDKTIMI